MTPRLRQEPRARTRGQLAHENVTANSTLSLLERACDDPDDSLLVVKVFPMLDAIRPHGRFQRLLQPDANEHVAACHSNSQKTNPFRCFG